MARTDTKQIIFLEREFKSPIPPLVFIREICVSSHLKSKFPSQPNVASRLQLVIALRRLFF